jgi:hypothetical protein
MRVSPWRGDAIELAGIGPGGNFAVRPLVNALDKGGLAMRLPGSSTSMLFNIDRARPSVCSVYSESWRSRSMIHDRAATFMERSQK